MKKIDYQTVASELREALDTIRAQRDNTMSADALHSLDKQYKSIETLAYKLASKLHVDKSAFLNACGL